jgi:hypothetical protein
MLDRMALSIACLGWGSLIWKPANRAGAPLERQGIRPGISADGGSWNVDGPMLPLELARNATSEDGAPYSSWVITPGSPDSPAMWAWLDLSPDVGDDVDRALRFAAQALATREGAALSCIGRWHRLSDPMSYAAGEAIAAWAIAHHVDGVVWTALTPRWFDAERAPTRDELLGLLRKLVAEGRAGHAEEYVRRTPAQTRSPYRAEIEAELGWRAS